MIVVSDTSPVNYLIQLEVIDLLPQIYGRVILPVGVLNELLHACAPESVASWAKSLPSWIEVIAPKTIDLSLPQSLDIGERDAISLALELHSNVLLIDDLAGRHEAEFRGIQMSGTLGVLLEAALRDLVDLPATMPKLRELGFRVSTQLEIRILERLTERKQTQENREG